MFRRKKDLRVLELSPAEKSLLIRAMLYFRNGLPLLSAKEKYRSHSPLSARKYA